MTNQTIEIIAGQLVEQMTVKEARQVAERGAPWPQYRLENLVSTVDDYNRLKAAVEQQASEAVN
jgi:hypothetical protein